MNKKILIAITDDYIRGIYAEFLQQENFLILETSDGEKALDLAKKEMPNLILADVYLPKINAFDLIKILRKDESTKKIPVMIFEQFEREEDRLKALEVEAKDFIIGSLITPRELLLRIQIHFGIQKTYRIPIVNGGKDIKQLATDLGFGGNLTCSKCGSPLLLYLIRDLGKGKDYFKVSFVCSKCG